MKERKEVIMFDYQRLLMESKQRKVIPIGRGTRYYDGRVFLALQALWRTIHKEDEHGQ